MANVQKYFEQFHAKIRVDYGMSKDLRDKRDIIVERIRKHLNEDGLPGFKVLLQGSYALKTGVIPLADNRYDIDVGLRFAITETDHEAAAVHNWVFRAVAGHTDKVEDKGPCVRVIYADGFHVDLVGYAHWEDANGTNQYRLAHKTNGWRQADPEKLLGVVETAMAAYTGTDDSTTKTNQFRRVVRYLRRWVDVTMSTSRRPTGLALTILAMKHLTAFKLWDGASDDLGAVSQLVSSLLGTGGRIKAEKPTPEYEDVMSKLSDEDMRLLKEAMQGLGDSLSKSKIEPDPVEACRLLRSQFGDDFPVPEPEDTAKKTQGPAIITTSTSA